MIGCSWVITTRGVAAVGLHDVARIHQSQTHAALDRRGDVGIAQVHRSVLHLPFIVLHRAFILQHGLFLVVHLLLRDGVAGESRFVAVQVDACFCQRRLVVRQLAFGLREGRLVGPRIDFQQRIALAAPSALPCSEPP